MRVVVDTNVFVSSLYGGNPRKIVELWKSRKITLCLSGDILEEYADILQRAGFHGEPELAELLSLFSLRFNILFTMETCALRVVKEDPDDDKFVECAVELKADAVVTGDKALLKIKTYRGISILTPREFLEKFSAG